MAKLIKSMMGMTEKPEQTEQTGKRSPISVLLTIDQLDHLDKIGHELGLNRHKLLRLIIQDFIHRWLAGDRPKVKTITKKETILDI